MIVNRIREFFQQHPQTPEPQPTTNLERKQQLLAHHVRLVARGLSNGLFVYGSKGGLGKTKVVLKTLANEGVKPVVLNSHVTPLALFSAAQANSDSIVVLDDADALFRNLAALGILRSALWGQVGSRRLVTYNSSQLDIPNRFEFSGAMILIANVIPKRNHAFDAVLSRIDQFELDATNEQVIELMRRLAVEGFEELPATQCIEVVDFISEFSATRELSLRLLEPSFRKVIYAQQAAIDWRDSCEPNSTNSARGERPRGKLANVIWPHFAKPWNNSPIQCNSSSKPGAKKPNAPGQPFFV